MINCKNINIEYIYITAVIAAFSLLFFSNANQIEGLESIPIISKLNKAFYLPCGIALLCSIFMEKPALDRIAYCINVLILLLLFACLIHPPYTFNILSWGITRIIMGVLCFKDIRHISLKKFVTILTYFSPFIVFAHYYFVDPFSYGLYRFGGFYGDANYLALAFNFLILCSYYAIKINKNLITKIIGIITILGSIPLIMLGISRGGIIGMGFLIIGILYDMFRTNKRATVIVFFAFILSYGTLRVIFTDNIHNIEARFSGEAASDEAGAMIRVYQIDGIFTVFNNRPELILFGIGTENGMKAYELYGTDGYYSHHVIHNTFFRILFEGGIFAFITYLYLLFCALMVIIRQRAFLHIAFFLSLIITVSTVPCIAFMPYWIAFFFLTSNDKTLTIQDKKPNIL